MAPNNSLPIHGNEKTMNMNHLILTNIQASPYFKVNLYELKTYHEVIDEIYYKVSHLEPWEKGSRKTAGQTGMCGGVRGVGAGGIVSSAYCLLYKLFTLRLTRKQVIGLCTHGDSPYIRALGFMYIRYTQPPADFWDWYEEYLEDDEEIDVKAGGGHSITIGEMLRQWLVKLEWYSTLFPRIPVPVQKSIEQKMKEWDATHGPPQPPARNDQRLEKESDRPPRNNSPVRPSPGNRRPTPPFDIAKVFAKDSSSRHGSREHTRDRSSRDRERKRSRSREKSHRHRSRSRDRKHKRSRSRSRDRKRKERRRSRSRDKRSRSRDRHRHKHRSRSRERSSRDTRDGRETSFERDLRQMKERQKSRRDY